MISNPRRSCKPWTWALLVSLCASTRGLADGQHVGNGGDPLEQIFENARLDAAEMVRRYDPNAVPPEFADVAAFLNAPDASGTPVHARLAADILASRYWFIEDRGSAPSQPTCARTNLPDHPPSDVRFSLTLCERIVREFGTGIAAELVIHEAAHHFGLTQASDEALAIRVGTFLATHSRDARPHWSSLSRTGEPSPRWGHAAQWTGTDAPPEWVNSLIVWGGCNGSTLPQRSACSSFLADGARYDEPLRRWHPLPAHGSPSPRAHAGSLWTAGDFLVWGGCRDSAAACRDKLGDGAVLHAASARWEPLPPGPSPRSHFALATTGKRAILWGGARTEGARDVGLADGALLRLTNGRWEWQTVSSENSPSPRFGATAVVVGNRAIFWGGCARQGVFRCAEYPAGGAIFDFDTETWEPLPAPEFSGRTGHTMSVIGRYVVIWGGEGADGPRTDGLLLDSETHEWFPLQGPEACHGHAAVVIGNEIVFLGGEGGSALRLRFRNPAHEPHAVWAPLAADNPAPMRTGLSAVPSPAGALVWGGFGGNQFWSHLSELRWPHPRSLNQTDHIRTR